MAPHAPPFQLQTLMCLAESRHASRTSLLVFFGQGASSMRPGVSPTAGVEAAADHALPFQVAYWGVTDPLTPQTTRALPDVSMHAALHGRPVPGNEAVSAVKFPNDEPT